MQNYRKVFWGIVSVGVHYYLVLSAKEFTMDQADRIACTVKIHETK